MRVPFRFGVGVLLLGVCGTVGACGSGESASKSCVSGERIGCISVDGCSGFKLCRSDGNYAACVCGGDAGTAGRSSNGGASSIGGASTSSSLGGRDPQPMASGGAAAGEPGVTGGTLATGTGGTSFSNGGTLANIAGAGGADDSAGGMRTSGGSANGGLSGIGSSAGTPSFGGNSNGGQAAGASSGTGNLTGSENHTLAGSCASPTRELSVVNKPYVNDFGGMTLVTAADDGSGVPVAEIDLRFCFRVIAIAPVSPASRGFKIYSGGVENTLVSPYYVNLGAAPISVDTLTDGSICYVIGLHQVSGADAAILQGKADIKVDWLLDFEALGSEAIIDPGQPHRFIVLRNGVIAACADVN